MKMTNGRNRWSVLGMAALAMGLVLHLALVLRAYPPAVFTRGDVPFRGDVSRYYATAHAAAGVGGLYGYDPYNMAGYPVGLWNSMGKKGFEVLHLLLPCLPLPQLFYLALVGVSILSPILWWLALRPFAPTRRVSGILFAVGLLYWHLCTSIAYFWNFGNVFFPACAVGIVVMAAAAHAILSNRRPALAALVLGLAASAVFYAHTVALVAAVAPLLALLAFHGFARQRPRAWAWLLAAAALFLALSVWWLVPLLQSRADCLSQPKDWFQSGPKHLIMDLFSDRVYQRQFDRNLLERSAAILGLIGLALAWRSQPLPAALAVGGVVALVITYAGSQVGFLRSVQPYRFLIPATLLLLAPAAWAIDAGIENWKRTSTATRRIIAVLLVLLAPSLTAYLIDLTWPRDPLGLGPEQREVVDWFQQHPPTGRVFCDDTEVAHVLPAMAGVHIIGGLSSQAFLLHRFAGVDDDLIAFGRPPKAWDEDSLRTYFATYGVEYVVLSSKPWLRVASRAGGLLEPMPSIGGHAFFRVRGADPDFVLEGSAQVAANYAGISVSAVTNAPLVLKFHYAPWLTAGPGVRLSPAPVLDDPVPFTRVELDPGIASFVIRKSAQ